MSFAAINRKRHFVSEKDTGCLFLWCAGRATNLLARAGLPSVSIRAGRMLLACSTICRMMTVKTTVKHLKIWKNL